MPIVVCVEVQCQGADGDRCHRCRNDFVNHIGDLNDLPTNATLARMLRASELVIANADSMPDKCAARL
jgi:hypothetical protein